MFILSLSRLTTFELTRMQKNYFSDISSESKFLCLLGQLLTLFCSGVGNILSPGDLCFHSSLPCLQSDLSIGNENCKITTPYLNKSNIPKNCQIEAIQISMRDKTNQSLCVQETADRLF